MPLAPGHKLGPYELVSPLGAGGMGEVYRARDARLGRDVAVKILPAEYSADPVRKQRFEREARTISGLNHPNICVLHDVGSQDGVDYLVMECVRGETLAKRMEKGPLPLEPVLKYGAQIADALDKAHRSGVVHRDLKPGNIMLTATGAKLLDFGLAKPAVPLASVATLTTAVTQDSPVTEQGTIVGTFQYMSPEQLEGKEADARSDIFALGCVLYEMATGKRAFDGKTTASVIAAILGSEPKPVTALHPTFPPALDRLVRECLAKDPDERWQTAHDIKLELLAIGEGAREGVPAIAASKSRRREAAAWVLALAGLCLALILGGLYFSTANKQAKVIYSYIPPPEKSAFVFEGDEAGPLVISPDGNSLAFVASSPDGKQMLWVRELNATSARALRGTEGATFPFWSANGRSLGFFADGKLKTIEVAGGRPTALCDAVGGRGGSWNQDDTILFAPLFQSPIYRISASGGTPVPITKVDTTKHTSHRWPAFLPDRKHFLYLAMSHGIPHDPNDAVFFASLDGKENRLVMQSFANVVYASGYLLFLRDNQLLAQPFDPDSGTLKGEAQRIADDVRYDNSTWRGTFDAAESGILAYGTGENVQSQLACFDRSGKRLGSVGEKKPNLAVARLSPRGDKVAIQFAELLPTILLRDLTRGAETMLTFPPADGLSPVWSSDGRWIAFASGRARGVSNLYRKRTDGLGDAELLMATDKNKQPTDWSSDGKFLLYANGISGSQQTVEALPLEGDRKPILVAAPKSVSSDNEGNFSADGRWVAYQSNESGRPEVYVVPFMHGGGRWQISTSGGGSARWRRDGREIFYLRLDNVLTAVPVTLRPESLELGSAHPLFRTAVSARSGYDVSPDGQRFLIAATEEQDAAPIALILNWTAELKKK